MAHWCHFKYFQLEFRQQNDCQAQFPTTCIASVAYVVCSELPTLVHSQNMTARFRQWLVALLSNFTIDNVCMHARTPVRTYVRTTSQIAHTMAVLGSNMHSATERDAVTTDCNGHTEQKKLTKCHLPCYTSTDRGHYTAIGTWCCITLILHSFYTIPSEMWNPGVTVSAYAIT